MQVPRLLRRLRQRPTPRGLLLVTIIALASVAVRLLLGTDYGTSAILYVAIPYAITTTLLIVGRSTSGHWASRYWNSFWSTFVVLFAVSIVLFEGIICVLMFLPLYLLVALLAMAAEALRRAGRTRLSVHALPVLVLAISLEGTVEPLSYTRDLEVRASRVSPLSAETLQRNLLLPIELPRDRHWLLGLFPMPYRVDAGNLDVGAVHTIHYRYARWLLTNVHEGRALLRIATVEPRLVETEFIEDTSFISAYVHLRGTRIDYAPMPGGGTRVTLAIHFERRLDPAWYFEPLQRYAVSRMAERLLDAVIVRDG